MTSAIGYKAQLVIVVSNRVFTYIVSFLCNCRKKGTVFWKYCNKAGYRLHLYSRILNAELFSERMNLKNKVLIFCTSPPKKRFITWWWPKKERISFFLESTRDNGQTRKHHLTMTKKQAFISCNMQHKKLPDFFSQKQCTSISYGKWLWRKTMRKVYMVELSKIFLFRKPKIFFCISHLLWEKVFQNPTHCKNFILESDKTKIFFKKNRSQLTQPICQIVAVASKRNHLHTQKTWSGWDYTWQNLSKRDE